MIRISLFILLWLSVTCFGSIFTPVLEIGQGKVRGLRSVSGQNRYYGIPYAAAERFQAPQPPPPWEGVYTAVSRLRHCAQTVSIMTLTNEDCLHLDVYSPETASQGHRLPVLVWIHGGGYYYGTKAHYDPEFLVAKNVVVVVINYRLGVFGFLCLKDIANLGLKDQTAALKWIRENIAAFGGDPDNVTVAGQSAGASSAAMHLLSKSSAGLFHKVFLMSGSSMTPWAFNAEPLKPVFEDASKLAKVKNEDDVYNVLANSTVEDLLAACADDSTNTRYFKYSPCVDMNKSDPFFHDTPLNTIKLGFSNNVPMMIGFTDIEGILFYGLHNDKTLKEFNEKFEEMMPSIFQQHSEEEKRKLAKKIKRYYFGKKSVDRTAVEGIVDYYSDWVVYSSTEAFTQLMMKYSDQPIYSYMFAYQGGRNFAKTIFGGATGMDGASHSDDIFYVFKPGGLSLLLSNPDRLFIDRLTTMIANFMKYGDPTPQKTALLPVRWPPRSTNDSRLLRLGHQLQVLDIPHSYKGGFMLDMLCSHGLKGYVPCDD